MRQLSTGVVGGILGGRINQALERRIGKRRTNLWSGITCIIIGLAALGGYLATEPFAPELYERVQIAPTAVYHSTAYRRDAIVLEEASVKYELNRAMWHDAYTLTELLGALRQEGDVFLWLKAGGSNNRDVRGLENDAVYLAPERGAALDNATRRAWLWLALFFFLVGMSGIGYGIYVHSKGA